MMRITNNKQSLDFFQLYDRMLTEMANGKKLLPSGTRYRIGTIKNYAFVRNNLSNFCKDTGFVLRIHSTKKLSYREIVSEQKYWKRFYKKFTDYLYKERGLFDNYVGSHVKILRAFFNYLQNELLIEVGSFHKKFYVTKEDIPIIVLSPEQLNYLIYDDDFDKKLSGRLKRIKDTFVFGCTVALRFSDLMALKRSNILKANSAYYLNVRSTKTKTFSQVRIPDYCIEIASRYSTRNGPLLPAISKVNFNKYIKELIELAGWTDYIGKTRERRGIDKEIKRGHAKYRFCDLITAHTMRRTAITTMLTLGVSEHIVRSISGHAPSSKEFFRYVAISQIYKDREVTIMHEKLKEKQAIA